VRHGRCEDPRLNQPDIRTHPDVIGQASYFFALNRQGPWYCPANSTPPTVDGLQATPVGALAQGGHMLSARSSRARGPPIRSGTMMARRSASGHACCALHEYLQHADNIGNGTVTTPEASVDGDLTTAAVLTCTHAVGASSALMQVAGLRHSNEL